MSLILSPFSWLLNELNLYFGSYGIAIMVFAIFVKILMFPFSIKGKRGMIQSSLIQGPINKIRKQYPNDPQKAQIAIQELYAREKVNPLSGCMWMMLPMFVLMPLYAIIRQPLVYILGLTEAEIYQLAAAVNWDTMAVSEGISTADMIAKNLEKNLAEGINSGFSNTGYDQLFLASLIPAEGLYLESNTLVEQMNFHFMGLDLTKVPNWRIWQDFSMQNLGTLFLVAISACSGVIYSKITQKTNKMNNNQEQTEQMVQTQKTMNLIMPIMSIWIGLIMPSIMVLYWICNNVLSMITEIFAGKILKKDYEEASRVKEKQALEEKEEERRQKEQKLLEIQRKKEEQAQNKGKKKKKKSPESQDSAEQVVPLDKEASRVGMRTYARGRAYDPQRYPNPHEIGQVLSLDSVGGEQEMNTEESDESQDN